MNAENFAYWLQGFFELTDSNDLTEEQVKAIKDHLALVFQKVTPQRGKKPKAETFVGDIESTSGSTTAPTAEDLMDLVKESARKQRETQKERRAVPNSYSWSGHGGFGRKYC